MENKQKHPKPFKVQRGEDDQEQGESWEFIVKMACEGGTAPFQVTV